MVQGKARGERALGVAVEFAALAILLLEWSALTINVSDGKSCANAQAEGGHEL